MAPSSLALEGKMYAFRNDLVGYLVRRDCAASKCWVAISVVQQGAMLPLCGCADVVPTMLILSGDVALSTRVRQRIYSLDLTLTLLCTSYCMLPSFGPSRKSNTSSYYSTRITTRIRIVLLWP
eukprot:COSAG01_NODE_467_length_16597_cov_10.933446_13_plen_123_part_00